MTTQRDGTNTPAGEDRPTTDRSDDQRHAPGLGGRGGMPPARTWLWLTLSQCGIRLTRNKKDRSPIRSSQPFLTAVFIIIEPVDGAGASRLLVGCCQSASIGCDAPICLPLTTGSIFMILAVGRWVNKSIRKGRGLQDRLGALDSLGALDRL